MATSRRESLVPSGDWLACEAQIRQFELACRSGAPADIESYLPREGPLRSTVLVELVHIELEFRLKAGRDTRVEEYLNRFPSLWENPNAPLDLIAAEFCYRREREPDLAPDDYAARFPQLRREILDRLERLRVEYSESAGRSCGCSDVRQDVAAAVHGKVQTMDAAPPMIPGYEFIHWLGAGGMGVVYLARHIALRRLVAIKMIRTGVDADREERARFRAEAEAAARLQHPHIVQVHEVGEHLGQAFCVLEYVAGGSLHQYLGGRPQPPRAAAELVKSLASAVQHAHSLGIIHRDLKPANILLAVRLQDASETVRVDPLPLSSLIPKVADFGLARQLADDSRLTVSGAIMGTPSYMAPEQAAGLVRQVGTPADVYSLGVVLYELLTGRPPFQGATMLDTLDQVKNHPAPPPRQLVPNLPRDLETICLKCLRKEPTQRYQSAAALAEDLDRFLAGRPIRARPVGRTERVVLWMRRRPDVASLIGFLILVSILGVAGIAWQWHNAITALAGMNDAQGRRMEAQIDTLCTAVPESVPIILENLEPVRQQAIVLLRERLRRPNTSQSDRIRLALALAPDEPERVTELGESLWTSEPAEAVLLRDVLVSWRNRLPAEVWRDFQNRVEQAADNATAPDRRFRSAVVLAGVDPQSERLRSMLHQVVDQLLNASPLHLRIWSDGLRPIRLPLVELLGEALSEPPRSAEERFVAATLLADYAADRPDALANAILQADPRQFAVLLPALSQHPNEAMAALHVQLAIEPAGSQDERDQLAKRQANAALALAGLGHPETLWPLLRHTPEPNLRSWLYNRFAAMKIDPQILARQLLIEKDLSIRRALIHSLGDYDSLSDDIKAALVELFSSWFRDDPDPGIHSATQWVLRRWGHEDKLATIESAITSKEPAGGRHWYVTTRGITMAVFNGPIEFQMGSPEDEALREPIESLHRRTIRRSFALSTKELTIEQFRLLKPDWIDQWKRATSLEFPASGVDWYAAAAFCRRLSELEGIPEDQMCYPPIDQIREGMQPYPNYLKRKGYRLPTESEWEYACRAGATTRFAHGHSEELLGKYGWYLMSAHAALQSTGLLKPNDFGMFDIHGNVEEWCQEWIRHNAIENKLLRTDDVEDTTRILNVGHYRVTRSGTCTTRMESCRCGRRGRYPPMLYTTTQGLRIARTLD